ncbi:MAG: hypothetical protein RL641_227 [Candidatus Parcubacteria bacterium]|jgi:hypothetical protein
MTTKFSREAFCYSYLGRFLGGLETIIICSLVPYIFIPILFTTTDNRAPEEIQKLRIGFMILAGIFGFIVSFFALKYSWLFSRIIKPSEGMIEKYREMRKEELLNFIDYSRKKIRCEEKWIADCEKNLAELKTL